MARASRACARLPTRVPCARGCMETILVMRHSQNATLCALMLALVGAGAMATAEDSGCPPPDRGSGAGPSLAAGDARAGGGMLAYFPGFAALAPLGPQAEEDKTSDALDRALAELPDVARGAAQRRDALLSVPAGGMNFRLIDVSLDALFAAGSSTERDAALESLQGGGHDPRKRGFTSQNTELSVAAAVDPYLNGEAHLIYFTDPISGETVVELEEAFATTQALPWGLQLEGGQFFTEFGVINPRHPHQWDWLDQPVVNTRFFGPDGMRGPGARLGWLAPLPWFSEVHAGAQNANGETMASFLANDEFFEERPVAGRPFVERDVRNLEDLVYLLRWENAPDLSRETTVRLGGSFLHGPNTTGSGALTRVYGVDCTVKWRPTRNERGWPFVTWQSEVIWRHYKAAEALDLGADPIDPADDTFFPRDTLDDWGFYSQLLWGFRRGWAAGVRYEVAEANGGDSVAAADDPFRDNRQRFSPLLAWLPTEFSRIRLQYNLDHAQHLLDGSTHSFWLGFEFFFGAHPAHKY